VPAISQSPRRSLRALGRPRRRHCPRQERLAAAAGACLAHQQHRQLLGPRARLHDRRPDVGQSDHAYGVDTVQAVAEVSETSILSGATRGRSVSSHPEPRIPRRARSARLRLHRGETRIQRSSGAWCQTTGGARCGDL